jgi:hypothetical protein
LDPYSVGIGDFNGDGKADLAVASSSGLSVLLGNGNGTFQAPTIYKQSSPGEFLAIADFNGDGKLDIAWPNSNLGLQVFLGNGNGTFQPPLSYGKAGPYPQVMITADFNLDGLPDVALAGDVPNTLAIFLGNPYTPTSTAVTSSASQANFAQTVTLTATVSPSTATGTVTFSGGNTLLGAVPVTGGIATLTTSSLPVGTYQISAVFNGSPGYTGSSGFLTEDVACIGLAPASLDSDSNAASLQVSVPASPSCAWSATTSSSWIQLSATAGTGPAALTVTLLPNTTGADLTGTITFGSQSIGVTQRFTAQVFADVAPSNYDFDGVNLLSTEGITNGCSAVPFDFCPTEDIIRSQMAIFIVRAILHTDDFPYSPVPWFTDVPVGSFGFQWIQKMWELGITNGCEINMFCPNDQVTRAQMAVISRRRPTSPMWEQRHLDGVGFSE